MTDQEKKLLERYRSLGTVEQLEALVNKTQPPLKTIIFPVDIGETVYYLKRDRTIVPCEVLNISKRFKHDYWEIILLAHDATKTKYRLALSQYNKIFFSALADAETAKETRFPKILPATNLHMKEKPNETQ